MRFRSALSCRVFAAVPSPQLTHRWSKLPTTDWPEPEPTIIEADVQSSASDAFPQQETAYFPRVLDGKFIAEPVRTQLRKIASEQGLSSELWTALSKEEERQLLPELKEDECAATDGVEEGGQTDAARSVRRGAYDFDSPPHQLPPDRCNNRKLYCADVLQLPHNVDFRSFRSNVSLRLYSCRSLFGGGFSAPVRAVLTAARAEHSFVSLNWLTKQEAQALGLSIREGACGTAVASAGGTSALDERGGGDGDLRRHRSAESCCYYYNSQDIVQPIDFNRYFSFDRRFWNVLTGKPLPSLRTIRLYAHFDQCGLTDLCLRHQQSGGLKSFLHVGTERDIREATGGRVHVLPDACPFAETNSGLGLSEPIFSAAQTSDPMVVVEHALLARSSKPWHSCYPLSASRLHGG